MSQQERLKSNQCYLSPKPSVSAQEGMTMCLVRSDKQKKDLTLGTLRNDREGSLPDSVDSDWPPSGLPALQRKTLGEGKEVLMPPLRKTKAFSH